MQVLSKFGAGSAYVVFMTVCFNSMSKLSSLYFWCGMMFTNYTMNQLKSLYAEPRPYWVSDEIAHSSCTTGFGNPSGHMINNSFFWVSLYCHIFYDMMMSSDEGFWKRKSVKFMSAIFLVVFLGLMALSRVYLGAHTLNEVLFGALLGSTMAAIGHFKVKPIFYGLPQMLYSREEEEKYDIDSWTYMKVLFSSLVLPMGLATLTLLLRAHDNENALFTSSAWLTRMKRGGCTDENLDPATILHYRHFEHSAIISLATGALMG